MFQNAMKFNMNNKRSLSPGNNHSQFVKHQKNNKQNQNYNYNGDVQEQRRQLPMWAARDSFLQEINK